MARTDVFTVKIHLENDFMQTQQDVAERLRVIADQIESAGRGELGDSANILDRDGNRVGFWSFAEARD